jgi:hypothetical protein
MDLITWPIARQRTRAIQQLRKAALDVYRFNELTLTTRAFNLQQLVPNTYVSSSSIYHQSKNSVNIGGLRPASFTQMGFSTLYSIPTTQVRNPNIKF